MALTAGNLVTRLAQTLRDDTNVHWTETEALSYLSDAQRAAVQIRPEIYPTTQVVALAAGTKQSIPNDAFSLIDVVRNMGTGSTPGRAIRSIDRSTLDHADPNWHSATGDAVVQHYTYDIRARREFYVYPPQPNVPQRVELVYAKTPAEITASSDALSLDDMYEPLLLSYMLHRAYAKQLPMEAARGGANTERSDMYYKMFLEGLMGGRSAQEVLSPSSQAEQLMR